MSEMTIYALKVAQTWAGRIFKSLKKGEARFGWSYIETADLHALNERYQRDGWDNLSEEEQKCFQGFLLEIKPDDYVVYINVPEWGRCTLAKVTRPYYWDFADKDFNHRLGVDPESVQDFDRNDAAVHPSLSSRLKLQGRWWTIYTVKEFEQLLFALGRGAVGEIITPEAQLNLLGKELRPLLQEITKRVHHTHPSASLELLLARVFEQIVGVKEVTHLGGASDHGADLMVVTEAVHPLTGELQQTTCVVQVKSFEGAHWDTQAVDDIKRAFDRYPDADEGMIISTADASTPDLEEALDQLRDESGKPVHLQIGEDVAAFILKHAGGVFQDTKPKAD